MSRQSAAIAVKKQIGLDSVGRILCNLRAGRGNGVQGGRPQNGCYLGGYISAECNALRSGRE